MGEQPESAKKPPGLRRGGALTISGAMCQQGSQLLLIWVISRYLGSEDLGSYVLAWAVLQVTSIMCMFGFRAALTRFVAIALADRDDGALSATVRSALTTSLIASLAAGALLVVMSGSVAEVLGSLALEDGLVIIGCALPAISLRELSLAATQGWQTQRPFTLIGWVYEPLSRLLLTSAALMLGGELKWAYVAILVSSWTSALAALVSLWRRMPRHVVRGRHPGLLKRLYVFSSVSWLTTIASTGLIWADTLILGALATVAAVGQYTVAARIVSLAVFVMPPINALFTPRFAHQHHVGQLGSLGQSYRQSTTWILLLSLPAFVLLITTPQSLLNLFGSEYTSAAAITVVLAVGQLVNAATGPCGTILNMCGKVSLNMYANLANLAFNIALNLLLIPHLGALGSAIAWSVSLTLVNVFRLVSVHRVTGAYPFDGQTVRLGAAAISAAIASATVCVLVTSEPARLLTVVPVIALVYTGLLLLLVPTTFRPALQKIRPRDQPRIRP